MKMPKIRVALVLVLFLVLPSFVQAAPPQIDFNPSVRIASSANQPLSQCESGQEVNLIITFKPLARMGLPSRVLRNKKIILDYILTGDVEFQNTVLLEINQQTLATSSNTVTTTLPDRSRDGVFTFIGRVSLLSVTGSESQAEENYLVTGQHGDAVDNDGDGYTEIAGDCDDSSATIFPGASESCGDGLDQDCDGSDLSCDDVDDDGDGYTENQGDCNDSSFAISPEATEECGDGIDQDCSGSDLSCDDVDDDGDGYTENQGDCNDSSADISPLATDKCGDGIDQDCSGSDLDCDDYDNDGDGYTENQGDCNDSKRSISPDSTEICGNEIDEDCDSVLNDGCDMNAYDDDQDGYTEYEGDCDDTNATVNPGAEEICDNTVDENCDGNLGGTVVSTESSDTKTELVTIITTLSPYLENEVGDENLFDSWYGTNAAYSQAIPLLDQYLYETAVPLSITDSLGVERDLTLYLDRTANDLQWEFLMTCDPEEDLRSLDSRGLAIYSPDTTYNYEAHKGAGALLWGTIDFDASGQILGMTAYDVPPDGKVEPALNTNLLTLDETEYYYSFEVNFTGSEVNDTIWLNLGAIYAGTEHSEAQVLVSDLGGLISSTAGAAFITSETLWADVYDQNGLQLTGDGTVWASDSITITGFDHLGKRVGLTYSINSIEFYGVTVQDFLTQLSNTFNCSATIDSFGRLVMTDLIAGPSGMYIENVVVDGTGDPTGTPTDDEANPFGKSGVNTDSVLNIYTSRRKVYAQGQLLGSDGISVLTSATTTWTSIYDDSTPVPNSIRDGDVFTFTGVKGEGSAVTASFMVNTTVSATSSGTVQDLLDWLETTFDCDAALDGAGRLVLTDWIADSDSSGGYFSQLAITDVSTTGTSNPFDDAGQSAPVAGSSFYDLPADHYGFDGSHEGANVSWEFVPETLSTDIHYDPLCQCIVGQEYWCAPDHIDLDQDGYTVYTGDCDESDSTIHPGAIEICGNDVDEDCDSSSGGTMTTVEPAGGPTGMVTVLTNLSPLTENETSDSFLFEAWNGTNNNGGGSITTSDYDEAVDITISDSLGSDRVLTVYFDRTARDNEWEFLVTCDPDMDQRVLDSSQQLIYAPAQTYDTQLHKGAGALLFGVINFDTSGQIIGTIAYDVPPDGQVEPARGDNRIVLESSDLYYSFEANFTGSHTNDRIDFSLGAQYAGLQSGVPQVLVSDRGALNGSTAEAAPITSESSWSEVYDSSGQQLTGDGMAGSSDSITVTGFDNLGYWETSTYYIDSTAKVQKFLTQLSNDFNCSATIDDAGRLVMTDLTSGFSGMHVESVVVDGNGDPSGSPTDDNANPFGETRVDSDSVLNITTSKRMIFSQGQMLASDGYSVLTSPSTSWTTVYDDDSQSAQPVTHGDQFVFSGFAGQGGAVTATFTVDTTVSDTSTGTVQDLLDFLEEEFGCDAAIDGAGRLVLTDRWSDDHLSSGYTSQLAIVSVVASGTTNPFDDANRSSPTAGTAFSTQGADISVYDGSKEGTNVSWEFVPEFLATDVHYEPLCQCIPSQEGGCDPDHIDQDLDGYTVYSGDCDESDSSIHPGALEICGNSVDENCDGSLLESSIETVAPDDSYPNGPTDIITLIANLDPTVPNEVNNQYLFEAWDGTKVAEQPAAEPISSSDYEESFSLVIMDSMGLMHPATIYFDRTTNEEEWEFLVTSEPSEDRRTLNTREQTIYHPSTTYDYRFHKGAGALMYGTLSFDSFGQIVSQLSYDVPPDGLVEPALVDNLIILDGAESYFPEAYYRFEVNFTGNVSNDSIELNLGAQYSGYMSGVAQTLVSDLGALGGNSAGANSITAETDWANVYDQNGLQLTGDGEIGTSDTISISGFDNLGQRVSSTYNVNSDSGKVSEFLALLGTDFNCTATIDSFGRLVMTDLTAGPSGMSVTSVVVDGTGDPTGQPSDDNANPFGETGVNTDSVLNITTSKTKIYSQGQLLASDGITVLTSATLWSSIYDDITPIPNSIHDGDIFTFSGLNGEGLHISASFMVDTAVTSTSTGTVQDLLDWLETIFDCDAALDGAGRLVLTDRVADDNSSDGYHSQLAIVNVTTTGASNPFDDAGQAIPVAGSSFFTLKADTSGFDGSREGANICWEFDPEANSSSQIFDGQCHD